MPYVDQFRVLKSPLNSPAGFRSGTMSRNGVKLVTSWNGSSASMWDGQQKTFSFRGNEETDYADLSGQDLRRNVLTAYSREYDTGHEFSTSKSEFGLPISADYNITALNNGVVGDVIKYIGPLWASRTGSASHITSGVSTATLDAYGRRFISDTIPTAPEVSLSAFLGELREQLPKIPGAAFTSRRTRPASSAGDEYLNWQFGLAPTGRDIGKLAFAVTQFNKRVKQLQKDSSLVVRRKRRNETLHEISVLGTSSEAQGVYAPRGDATTFGLFSTASADKLTVFREKSTEVWFSGAYSYHLAEAHSFLGKLERYDQLANSLLGTRITPDTVWQLTPWSWLLDWVSDAGVFVKNLSYLSSDNLVLRYGYVMAKTTYVETKTVVGLGVRGNLTPPITVASTWSNTIKQRRRATPYGFGLDLSSFTSRQWSILAALGLTKGDKSLRRSG